jgi:hypothetical protein
VLTVAICALVRALTVVVIVVVIVVGTVVLVRAVDLVLIRVVALDDPKCDGRVLTDGVVGVVVPRGRKE